MQLAAQPVLAPAPAQPRWNAGAPLQSRSDASIAAATNLQVDFNDDGNLRRVTVADSPAARAAAHVVQLAGEYVARATGAPNGNITGVRFMPDALAAGSTSSDETQPARITISGAIAERLARGIERLRSEPWETWGSPERGRFAFANQVALHEASHRINTNRATPADAPEQYFPSEQVLPDFEESITELASATRLTQFLRETYGIEAGADVSKLVAQRASSPTLDDRYSGTTLRLQRVLAAIAPDQVAELSTTMADHVRDDMRAQWLTDRLAERAGRTVTYAEREATRNALTRVSQGPAQAVDGYAKLNEIYGLDLQPFSGVPSPYLFGRD